MFLVSLARIVKLGDRPLPLGSHVFDKCKDEFTKNCSFQAHFSYVSYEKKVSS